MSPLLQTLDAGTVRVVTMDDGKANVLSMPLLQAIDAELAAAESAGRPLVITGRPGVFSGGFDLNVLRRGGAEAAAMLEAGARLTVRLLRYPAPLVTAVNGHAMAMGAFVALGGDARIGTSGTEYRIAANEVAVGLTMPRFATALLRHRLTGPAFDSAAITSRPSTGADALAAGWFDELAEPGQLPDRALARAEALARLDARAYAATKLRIRERVLAELQAGIDEDVADWRARLSG